jgi:hypothetical protein
MPDTYHFSKLYYAELNIQFRYNHSHWQNLARQAIVRVIARN